MGKKAIPGSGIFGFFHLAVVCAGVEGGFGVTSRCDVWFSDFQLTGKQGGRTRTAVDTCHVDHLFGVTCSKQASTAYVGVLEGCRFLLHKPPTPVRFGSQHRCWPSCTPVLGFRFFAGNLWCQRHPWEGGVLRRGKGLHWAKIPPNTSSSPSPVTQCRTYDSEIPKMSKWLQ